MSDHDEPLLEVTDLIANYPLARGLTATLSRQPREWVHAVNRISFSVKPGEMLALVGESGSGKTTTAQSAMRMVPATSGSIRFRDRELTTLSARELRAVRREMQIIYQDPYESLDPRFRVRETVAEPLEIHKIGRSHRDREELVVEALTLAGLIPAELYLDRYPHELSGGQRQRVAIAASMVLRPKLLIADEPVSMLDVSVRAGILALLDRLRRELGLGILMITHDLSTASRFADRICVMYLGQIVEQGPAREVIHDPQHPYTKALLSVVPRRDPRETTRPQLLAGEPPDPIDLPAGCSFHPRCPVATPACRDARPPLRRIEDESSHQAACILIGQQPQRTADESRLSR